MKALLLIAALALAGCDRKDEAPAQPAPPPPVTYPMVTAVSHDGWSMIRRSPPDEFGVACYYVSVSTLQCLKVRE